MKTTAKLGLVLCALSVTALADDAPASPAKPAVDPMTAPLPDNMRPAPEVRQPNILPGMPTFSPPPPPEAKKLDQPNTPADGEVLVLPKLTVKQKPRPRLNADIVYAPKDLGNLLARQKYTQLDQALNKFTLPLFGQSLAERALEEHEREKKQAITADVLNLAKAVEQTDPEEAKSLKKAVTMP
jgi:hypothetical protein